MTRRTRKNHPLLAMEKLIDWVALDRVIYSHYAPVSDAAGRPAYSGLLLFKMLLVGIWYGGLSDERVEAMANENLSVMRFLGLDFLQRSLRAYATLAAMRLDFLICFAMSPPSFALATRVPFPPIRATPCRASR